MASNASWLIPPGVIMAYAGPPSSPDNNTNWLYCDGTPYPTSTYPDLANAIGTAFGGEGGDQDFWVPDLRGYFLRGVDNGAGRDPDSGSRTNPVPSGGNSGDQVGSAQACGVQGLTSYFEVQYSSGSGTTPYFGSNMNNVMGGLISDAAGWTPHPAYVSPSGAETRPINIYVNYLICVGIPMPTGSGGS